VEIVFVGRAWREVLVRLEGERGRTLRSEEFAGDVELFAANNYELLAVEELFGDCAGQTTKEMALAVDDDLGGSVSIASTLVTASKRG